MLDGKRAIEAKTNLNNYTILLLETMNNDNKLKEKHTHTHLPKPIYI